MRIRLAFTLGLCLLLLGGCKRRQKQISVQTDEDGATLSSVIYMADAKSAPQLLKGFHGIEGNAWRWTMGNFAVALRPPRNSAVRGAVLHLKFALPDAVIANTKKVTLSASVNGTALPPETYSAAGEFEYTREVDPKLLAGDAVNVEFTLDKFLPAGAVDGRELGLVASSVGFEAK
jgi:hypothetical protein